MPSNLVEINFAAKSFLLFVIILEKFLKDEIFSLYQYMAADLPIRMIAMRKIEVSICT
jgi:hypothetical protein